MNYKVGDRVKIKSLYWYIENKDVDGLVHCGDRIFDDYMSVFCGTTVTIGKVYPYNGYGIKEDMQCRTWTDEMIEGLVLEKPKPKFYIGDRVKWFNHTCNIIDINTDEDIYTYLIKHYDYREGESFEKWVPEIELTFEDNEETPIKIEGKVITNNDMIVSIDEYILPDGYIFKDENGNVINATKIILEKKKKEYPKTYGECSLITGYEDRIPLKIIGEFTRLINARNAYWKLYGEEMGLGKSWAPDWKNDDHESYLAIVVCGGKIIKSSIYTHDNPFAFPTPEMRDAFHENFKEEIESCKELL